jgi:hypothetical protein
VHPCANYSTGTCTRGNKCYFDHCVNAAVRKLVPFPLEIIHISTNTPEKVGKISTYEFINFIERNNDGKLNKIYDLKYYRNNYKSLEQAIIEQQTKFKSFRSLFLLILEFLPVKDLARIIVRTIYDINGSIIDPIKIHIVNYPMI